MHAFRHRLAVGPFLLRLVVAVAILLRDSGSNLVETGSAFLLVAGLWTSTISAVIALIEMWSLVSGSGGWVSVLLAAITIAVALTGPGAWSVDAQWRGWHRIQIPHGKVTAMPDRVDRDAPAVRQRRGARLVGGWRFDVLLSCRHSWVHARRQQKRPERQVVALHEKSEGTEDER